MTTNVDGFTVDWATTDGHVLVTLDHGAVQLTLEPYDIATILQHALRTQTGRPTEPTIRLNSALTHYLDHHTDEGNRANP